MNMFEFTVFAIYLALLTLTIVAIQYFNPDKVVREEMPIQFTEETLSDSEVEEASSEEENPPFHPEREFHAMTENQILRHRIVSSIAESTSTETSTETETEIKKPYVVSSETLEMVD